MKHKYGGSKARSHMMKQRSMVDDLYRGSNDKTHKYCGSKVGYHMVPCYEESLNLVPISDVPKDPYRNDIVKIYPWFMICYIRLKSNNPVTWLFAAFMPSL